MPLTKKWVYAVVTEVGQLLTKHWAKIVTRFHGLERRKLASSISTNLHFSISYKPEISLNLTG